MVDVGFHGDLARWRNLITQGLVTFSSRGFIDYESGAFELHTLDLVHGPSLDGGYLSCQFDHLLDCVVRGGHFTNAIELRRIIGARRLPRSTVNWRSHVITARPAWRSR